MLYILLAFTVPACAIYSPMTRTAKQIPLALAFRPSLSRGDFFITQSNEAAVAMIDKWPNWGSHLLVLQGAAASGKTHLAAVWQEKTGARKIAAQDIADISHPLSPIIIDGVDTWLGDRDFEIALFHLHNIISESQQSLMLTTRAAPSHIDFVLPDLASRMRGGALAQIAPPDDALLAAVLTKLFYDRQIDVGEEVISYILPRMERSFAAARDIVANADTLALSVRGRISVPLMRKVLADMQD